jgi:hypothetical protein
MKGERVFMGSLTKIEVYAWPHLGGKPSSCSMDLLLN